MERKMDRRTLATKGSLTRAFVRLLLSRGYDNVSPSEIAREAGVTRSTLYLHFRGKEALLSAVLQPRCATLASCVGSTDEMHELVVLLAHFREQRRLNATFFCNPVRMLWVNALRREITIRLRRSPQLGRPTVPLILVAVAIAEMQVGFLTHWLQQMPHISPQNVAKSLTAHSMSIAHGA